jgi:HlyD family secretion protein
VEEARPAQTLRLVFSSLPVSEIPEVGDGVKLLSADALADERAGMHNFMDEIALDTQMPEQLGGVAVVPGMPVDAFIRTDDRTQFSYLRKPLTDYFRKTYRET